MLLVVLLAVLFAKFRKYKVSGLIRCFALYPFFCMEFVYIFFQINVFLGNYVFIPYAPYLKNAYLYMLIIPIVVYKLYKPALVGSCSLIGGSFLNWLVMYFNGGKMPVYPTLSILTGYYSEAALTGADSIHCLGTADTHLKILSDFIDVGWSVLSIGDLFIKAFVFIIVFYTIKEINKRAVSEKVKEL